MVIHKSFIMCRRDIHYSQVQDLDTTRKNHDCKNQKKNKIGAEYTVKVAMQLEAVDHAKLDPGPRSTNIGGLSM
jgi:hypothetical protein